MLGMAIHLSEYNHFIYKIQLELSRNFENILLFSIFAKFQTIKKPYQKVRPEMLAVWSSLKLASC